MLRALGLLPCALLAPYTQAAAAEPNVPRTTTTISDLSLLDEDRWVEAVSRRRQPIAFAPQSVSVIDAKDLSYSPGINLVDSLRYEAGIDVQQARHGQYLVGLRGTSAINAPRTLALYDGRQFRFEQIGVIPWVGIMHHSDIDRIEIVRGPASVNYGANAFGGVISISRRPLPEQFDVRVFSQIGNDGLVDADATLASPLGSGDFWSQTFLKISLGASSRDDLPGHQGATPGSPHPRIANSGKNDLSALRLTSTLTVPLPNDHSLELEYARNELDNWDLLEDYTAGVDQIVADVDTLSLRLKGDWGEFRHIRTYTDIVISNQKSTYDPSLQPDYWYFQAGVDDMADLSRLQFVQVVGSHYLTLGGEYEHLETESSLWSSRVAVGDRDNYETVTITNIAGFIEDQWLLNEQWALTAGIRVDDHSEVGVNTSPRLAINYTPSPQEFFRLSWSSGYRLPNSIEKHLVSRFFASSPDLNEEHIQSADLGWQRLYPDQGLELNATAFYSRANNLITFQPIPEAQMASNWDSWINAQLLEISLNGSPDLSFGPSHFFEYDNLDNPLHTYGLELASRWSPQANERWTFWGNVTWLNAKHEKDIIYTSNGFLASGPPQLGGGQTRFRFDRNLGKEINTGPDWKANAGALFKHKGAFLSVAGRFVDKRDILSIAYSTWNDADPDELRVQELNAYIAFDLAIGYHWGKDDDPDGSLKFSVMNIFDSGHYEFHEVGSDVLTPDLDQQYSSEIGRAIALTGQLHY